MKIVVKSGHKTTFLNEVATRAIAQGTEITASDGTTITLVFEAQDRYPAVWHRDHAARDGIHTIQRYVFDNSTDRIAFTNERSGYSNNSLAPTVNDLGAVARQLSDETYWLLTGYSPIAWLALGGDGVPAGPAGGDLGGTYPNPTVTRARGLRETGGPTTLTMGAVGAGQYLRESAGSIIGSTLVVDDVPGTGSLRTLGTGAQQAAAGNDSRFTDARTPTGAAGGDLTGSTYPNPIIASNAITTAKLLDANVTLAKLADLANQRLIARNTAGTGVPESVTIQQVLDWLSTTRGAILYRGASGWAARIPNTPGYVLTDGGVGADPDWASPTGGGTPTSGLNHQQVMARISIGV